MNKTISINLGGFSFHIDEDAYQKLSRYFDAVKRSLSPDGRDEIINDIESRIAELFQERLPNEKQVVGLKEIDEVIAIMGQPEDYKIDEDNTSNFNSNYYNKKSYYHPKKLYRDRDNSMLGGVASGFGHYLNIDPLWIRILFIISPFISFGSSIVIYIILWILIPEAITNNQKLEMKGEPITISNIEKKVKEGIEDLTSKINNLDHQKIANTAKSGANQIAATAADVLSTVLKIISKILGSFIVFIASIVLIALLIGTILLFFTSTLDHVHMPWNEYLRASNYTDFPMWILYIFTFFSLAIPVFFFLILGLKLLISNLKSIGNYAKYSLLGLWILSVAFLIYFGLRQASEVSKESKVIEKREIAMTPNDTLKIKMKYNDFYAKSVTNKTNFKFTVDQNDKEIVYSNNVKIHFMKTDEANSFIQIEKIANGSSFNDAKTRAKNIAYHYDIQGNNVILENYLVTDRNNKFRDQEVHIYIYFPNKTIIYPDETISEYVTNRNSDIDKYYGKENHHYKLIDNDFKCLDCPTNENEDKDWIIGENNDEVELSINGQNIITTKTEIKTINIDKNGIKIKTEN